MALLRSELMGHSSPRMTEKHMRFPPMLTRPSGSQPSSRPYGQAFERGLREADEDLLVLTGPRFSVHPQ